MKFLSIPAALLLATSLLSGCSTGTDHSAPGAKDPAPAVLSDAHAGHAMTASPPATIAADPHAGHAMLAEPSGASSADPHAGHNMAGTPAEPKAHSDHHSRYGGVLTMEGDYHVEAVVAPDGAVDLYVSDAIRKPVAPGDARGSITIEAAGGKDKVVLPLTENGAKGSLSAKGPVPDGSTTYTWELEARKTKLKMSLAVPKGGTKSIASPAASQPHKH